MHAAVKVLIGLILIAIGFGLFVDELVSFGIPLISDINWFSNFVIALTGVIPPFLIIIGLFVVWLEIDEIKAERELRAEEEKEKMEKKEKPKPGRPAKKK